MADAKKMAELSAQLGITRPPKAGARPPAPPAEVDVVVASATGAELGAWLASWPSLAAYHLIVVLTDPAADAAKVAASLPGG